MNRPARAVAMLVIAALAGALMLDAARKIRKHRRDVVSRVFAHDRFIDASVRLVTVVADPTGDALIPGKPRLRVLRERTLGGVIDTRANPPRFVDGAERSPVTWYVSEDQEQIVLHADDVPLGQLVYGSEGAGKTKALVMWLYCRWIEHIGAKGAEFGITAPTETRLDIVLAELRNTWPARWFTYRVGEGVARLVDGALVRFISTYQQSAAQGSRVQGFNLWACGSDELQDSLNAADDIESRGRAAPNGRYKRLGTATAKDDPDWREFRDKLDAARGAKGEALWIRRTLSGERSPFVDPSFWAAKRASMSAREARRRLDAMDVAPERATYPSWDRTKNLIALTDIGWHDVTTRELALYLDNATVLAGHDPGNLCDVTLLLKAYVRSVDAYLRGRERPRWIVVDEVTTEATTKEAHVRKVLELVRSRWRCNMLDRAGRPVEGGAQLFVRCDPAGDSDNKPDKSVYTIWQQHGVIIRPAAWSKANPLNHGRIPKDAGIEVVNTLLCNSLGDRFLFVARNSDGSTAAPRLVAAIETSERDLAGKAETQLKRKGDVSHWPAALRYALWLLERPRLNASRSHTA